MFDDMDSRMKMLGFNRAKQFFPYDEGRKVGEIYLIMAPTGAEDEAAFCDDMDLFDMDAEGEGSSDPDGKVWGGFEDGPDGVYDDEPDGPYQALHQGDGRCGLLTREGEKEIAVRIEEAKEEIKDVLMSYPGTVKELLNAILQSQDVRVESFGDSNRCGRRGRAGRGRGPEGKDRPSAGSAETGLQPIEEG